MMDVWSAENTYFLNSHPSRIGKLLAHYTLYSKIITVGGCFIEVGLFKGASFARFATFRHLLESDAARKFYGFDVFGEFPKENIEGSADLEFIDNWGAEVGGGSSRAQINASLIKKGFSNYSLIEGNVFETLPKFLEENKHLKIAFLHLDVDVYEPTKFCLDKLLPLMSKGGLVVFDDYNAVEGATRAADELGYPLTKLPISSVPSFFQVK